MNLYRINCKRKYVRGFQLENESFIAIASSQDKAKEIIKLRFGNELDIENIKRCQDGEYFINDTYILDTVS